MIDTRQFLDAVAGYTQAKAAATDPAAQKGNRLGTVDPAYTTGKPKVTLDGTTTLSAEGFSYLSSYTPTASDRVLLAPVGSTYVIIGDIIS